MSYRLTTIPSVSPTLAETLRVCPLQAALSRIIEIRDFVLGNPKAWLGTAYHEVLENLWTPNEGFLSEDELIEQFWQNAIARLLQKATKHPLNRRFAVPEKWPGYYLARSFVQIRAKEALAENPRQEAGLGQSTGTRHLEQDFSAMNGKLIGKPDVVLNDEIRDYKSGSVYDDTHDGKQTVKQSYVRQLRLYGYLVYQQLGRCPRKGKLLPMQDRVVEVDLDVQTSTAEALDAVALLDSFNDRLGSVSKVSDLANPSPTACRWCQFKVLCPAFWNKVDETWAQDLGSGAVSGVLDGPPTIIHNGLAFSIVIKAWSGTTGTPQVRIAPLAKEIYPQLAALQSGEAVRIVGLYRRNDRQVTPTTATVCLRDADCLLFTLPRDTR